MIRGHEEEIVGLQEGDLLFVEGLVLFPQPSPDALFGRKVSNGPTSHIAVLCDECV